MNKLWYVHWQKRLTQSREQLLLWRFLGINIVFVYLAVGMVLLILPQFRQLAIEGLLAVGLGWGVLVKIVRLLMPKKRPYQQYRLDNLTGGLFSRVHESPNSFPSGHAGSLASLSTVLIVSYPILGILSFLIVAANGFARIVLGYHYALDVVVGSILGIFAGIVAVLLV